MRSVSRGVRSGGLALLLFGLWCGLLTYNVVHLRAGVETNVGWLIELQAVQAAADGPTDGTAERLDALVVAAQGTEVEPALRDLRAAWTRAADLPPNQRTGAITQEVDAAVRAVRGQTAALSVELGGLWDSLIGLVLAALLLGAVALLLLHVADRRQRRAEALHRALEDAEGRRTLLLAQISHDLRAPLSAVMIAHDLLTDGPRAPDDDDSSELLRIVHHGAEALSVLVNDLQSLAWLDRGELEIRRRPLEVRQLMDRCTDIAAALAFGRDLRIVPGVAASLPNHWMGDEDRLRQVLLNLLANAIKFSAQGEIELTVAESARGGLVFRVRDSGRGIPPEALARMFEPWHRGADEGARAQTEGSGLGLSICHELVAAMDGSIDVTSEVGVGTEFTVDLQMEVLPDPPGDSSADDGGDRALPPPPP